VTTVGIVGASGYSGAVFTRLAAQHPNLTLAFATSDQWIGERVAKLGLPDSDLLFRAHEDARTLASNVDVVVLATSAEQAMKLAPALETRVVDLSGAFRLDAASYPAWYGFEHEAPAALERAFYGLPELFGAPPSGTRIVANPGCYATAALLATAPLLRDGLVESDRVIVDGKSGISGAGRRSEASYSFVELAEEVRAYKVGKHPHTAEIARHVHRYADTRTHVTFTPHLVPVRRGLVVTSYMNARSTSTEALHASFMRAYDHAPFVRVVPIEEVSMHAVVGSPYACVGAAVSDGVVVSMCAIDNLMKGAASQAMQNVNALIGLPATAGLTSPTRFAP